MRLAFLLLTLAAACAAVGCNSAAGDLPVQQLPEVSVANPLAQEVRDIDEYTGRTEAAETVEVRSRVSGYLENIFFEDGEFVKKGQDLFLIDPRTYQAELEQAQARVALYKAKHDLAVTVRTRNEGLLRAKAVSQEEFDQADASEKESLAAHASAVADTKTNALNVKFTLIKAEINGRIDRTFVTRGNLVQSGPGATLLTRIVSVDPMFVYFYPDELAFLRYTEERVAADGKMEAQHVRMRELPVSIVLADGTTYAEPGVIDFAANSVDPSTGTIQVRASFKNPKRALTPGLFVRLRIADENAYQALMIPERAINTDQSDKFVFVVNSEKKVERRIVQLGTKQGKLRVIKQGLAPNDLVVISGGLLVRQGTEVTTKEVEIDASSLPVLPQLPPIKEPAIESPATETPTNPTPSNPAAPTPAAPPRE
jgi:RND family efflux transporter MFP subunit